MVRFAFVRFMEGTSDDVARQSVRVDTTDRAPASFFAAQPAVDFVRRGFMRDSGGMKVFYGPDAEVLLDDSFATAYCFRLADAPPERARQVGLSFAPAERVLDRVDIEGTLWVDTAARALREIRFRYVGLPPSIAKYEPGGDVTFGEVTPGVALVDRWSLRLAGVGQDSIRYSHEEAEDYRIRTFFYVRESGGVLAHATWPDGRHWHAHLGRLVGRATRSDRHPAAGAVVTLRGAPLQKSTFVPGTETPYRAVVDSAGRFEFHDLVAGPYSVVIADPAFAPIKFEIPTSFGFSAADDSTTSASVELPTAEEYTFNRCREYGKFGRADSVFVFGRVMTPAGEPIDGVSLNAARSARGDAKGWKPAGSYKGTGTDGLFFMCFKALGVAPNDTRGDTLFLASRYGDRPFVDAKVPIAGNLTVVPVVGRRP